MLFVQFQIAIVASVSEESPKVSEVNNRLAFINKYFLTIITLRTY